MGFKLVRTDSVEVCKIKLPAGKHVIGRGKLLDCNDKRVSRSHGVLEVTQNTVFVKALHQNPCFFIKKGTKETKIIKQDCAQEIGNGDRFGLLPDLYWYELICCTFVDDDQHQLLDIGEIKTDADSVKTEPFEFENMDTYQENFNLNDTDVNDKTGSPSLLPPEDQDTASADKECSPHLKSPNKRSLNSDREDSCSAVKKSKTDVEEPNVKQEPAASPGPVVMKEPNDEQDINNSDKQESNDEQDINNSDKQVPNEEQNINNSVKQEPNNEPDLKDSVTQEPNDGQDLNNSAAGAGNDQAGTSGTNDKGTADSSANSTRKRERCMYGANCYRPAMAVTYKELIQWTPPAEDLEPYNKLVEVLYANFPQGWESWEVSNLSVQHFSASKTPDMVGRIRFAVPTVELIRCFEVEAASCSKRIFKNIKRKIINWPIGPTIIYAPNTIARKIRTEHHYIKFMNMVKSLKPRLITRGQASKILKVQSGGGPNLSSTNNKRGAGCGENLDHPRIQTVNLINKSRNTVTSTQNEQIWHVSIATHSERSSSEPPSRQAPTILVADDLPAIEDNLFNFNPTTNGREPKILSRVSHKLIKQGLQCQRLDSRAWSNIKWSDVQKQFKATPPFSSLIVNSLLAHVTPHWQQLAVLKKMDLTLGAVTHGLLKQRQDFQEIYDNMPSKTQAIIGQKYLAPDSEFLKTSDDLLQYVCGRRTETIKKRRAVYKAQDKQLNKLLHDIPPSATHLFSEPALTELIKEHGGVDKFHENLRYSFQRIPK